MRDQQGRVLTTKSSIPASCFAHLGRTNHLYMVVGSCTTKVALRYISVRAKLPAFCVHTAA